MICSIGALGLICAVYVQYKHSQVAAIKHRNQLKSCRTCTCSCLGYHLNRTLVFSQGDKLSWFCYGIPVDGGINHSVKQMLLKQYKTSCKWHLTYLQFDRGDPEGKERIVAVPVSATSPHSAGPTLCMRHRFSDAALPQCAGEQQEAGQPLQGCAGLRGSIPRLAMPGAAARWSSALPVPCLNHLCWALLPPILEMLLGLRTGTCYFFLLQDIPVSTGYLY